MKIDIESTGLFSRGPMGDEKEPVTIDQDALNDWAASKANPRGEPPIDATMLADVTIDESIIERGRGARAFINEAGEEPGEAPISDELIMWAAVVYGQLERRIYGWVMASIHDPRQMEVTRG